MLSPVEDGGQKVEGLNAHLGNVQGILEKYVTRRQEQGQAECYAEQRKHGQGKGEPSEGDIFAQDEAENGQRDKRHEIIEEIRENNRKDEDKFRDWNLTKKTGIRTDASERHHHSTRKEVVGQYAREEKNSVISGGNPHDIREHNRQDRHHPQRMQHRPEVAKR